MVHACYHNTWVVEAGDQEAKPGLHSDTQASLGYKRLCLKTKQNITKQNLTTVLRLHVLIATIQ